MDSYHEIDTIKIEKQKAMQRYNNFKKIANIVRTLEIVVAITLISYSISFTSSYFPAAVEFSAVFFRRISSLLFSPHFVFLVGNVIIITLFAKSSGENKSSDKSGEEILTCSENLEDELFAEKNPSDEKISENSGESENVVGESPANIPVIEERENEEKVYRRTQSTVEMTVVKEDKKELRRSTTEVRRKIGNVEKSSAIFRRRENRKFEEDELSNEEFNKKVEAFIAKQQRFLMEEKLAVVVSN
ncbi:hypothetical protein BVRB_1g007090 [Beta vulgaris subsp. vulgaris]|uniref:uncharacterized protein LOC104889602 n=1 Tax=Beta vulgaris subsp. vulgaris TaxID=3555 RepID=UPI00053F73E2|nr:uncharacterized protein LOC104889602 [Beta vulgaris subsp. vulgaris]KMT20736.1 hypothetical protein BVRB_1g007090 [Beta vulgaris subsp. vulgaris]